MNINTMEISYETSAAVYNVTSRSKADPIIHSNSDFQYTFEGYVHPSYVLKDSISLYKVTEIEATYVDCGNKDVFDSQYTFVYNA